MTTSERLFQIPRAGLDSNSDGAGRLDLPKGIGTDPKTGHIFIAEVGNARISEFTSWGAFVKAWGWGVSTGANEFEICGPSEPELLPDPELCQQGIVGDGPGQFGTVPGGVAVDPNGNIYVYDETRGLESHARVQKFSPSGDLLWLVGGEVNQTDGTNLCTKADLEAGDECGGGSLGTANGQFNNLSGGNFVAIGPNDTLYVGDAGRIQEFNFDGTYKGEIKLEGELAGKTVRSLAIDKAGNLYVALVGEDQVRKLSATGAVLSPSFAVNEPLSIAVDREGFLYVVIDPDFLGKPSILEFAPDGTMIIGPGEFRPTPEGETFRVNGIATNVLGDEGEDSEKAGDLYVGAYSNSADSNRSYVAAYGPEPTFEPAPPAPPSVTAQFASEVGTTTATLSADINPHFFAGTTYYVEYGTGKCSEGGCTETSPAPPGDPLGAKRDEPARAAGIALTDLEPGTTYHFRFVAISGTFTTKGLGEDEDGGESTFITSRGPNPIPPDSRAYELVSPTLKNNAELSGGSPGQSVAPMQASLDGSAVTYTSFTAFGADPESAPAASQYLSRRGPGGWATQNITPRDEESYLTDPLRGFSRDLSKGAVVVLQPPLTEDAPQGYESLYVMDTASEALQLVTPSTPPELEIPRLGYCIDFAGASEDFSHVYFAANGKLTPEAGKPASVEQVNLYEWSEGTGVRLVNKLPNNTVVQPKDLHGFGASLPCRGVPKELLRNVVSADGSKAFWQSASALYARVDGTTTVQLDLKQGGPGPSGGGTFWDASDDGSKVFFTDPNKLTAVGTAGSAPGDLYRYDFDKPLGSRLENLTPTSGGLGVMGVVGASEDGSAAYFASGGVLAGNEGPAGGTAEAGAPNLYKWKEGEGVIYIATLSGGGKDSSNWSMDPGLQSARVTPDGKHLAFVSTRALTGFDNTDQETGKADAEVFLYDAGTDELVCASCRASGARPSGSAALPTWSTPFEQRRYLSDDGQRLFFETTDAIDVEDTNGLTDVYEFELEGKGGCSEEGNSFDPASGGCAYLISTGTSTDVSRFVDASGSGDDVFFTTRQQLVPRDIDERVDVYDARVGGFEPPLPPEPEPCDEAAGCRGQVVGPAPPTAPGVDPEPGNLTPKAPKHCRKGTHKVKKKGKVRCVKNKKRHHKASQNRRAAR
ncbi:MAG TPA: hypothetical protein VFU11_04420 [Solirubrobacterales bacterium]|nr:hypothetical protein [Solirubrobacterales bacterium]